MSYKKYKCKECGFEKMIDTNHYGECYNLFGYNKCQNQKCPCFRPIINATYKPTTWICAEMPTNS